MKTVTVTLLSKFFGLHNHMRLFAAYREGELFHESVHVSEDFQKITYCQNNYNESCCNELLRKMDVDIIFHYILRFEGPDTSA